MPHALCGHGRQCARARTCAVDAAMRALCSCRVPTTRPGKNAPTGVRGGLVWGGWLCAGQVTVMALTVRVWSPLGSVTMRVTIPTKTGLVKVRVGLAVVAVVPLGKVHR